MQTMSKRWRVKKHEPVKKKEPQRHKIHHRHVKHRSLTRTNTNTRLKNIELQRDWRVSLQGDEEETKRHRRGNVNMNMTNNEDVLSLCKQRLWQSPFLNSADFPRDIWTFCRVRKHKWFLARRRELSGYFSDIHSFISRTIKPNIRTSCCRLWGF